MIKVSINIVPILKRFCYDCQLIVNYILDILRVPMKKSDNRNCNYFNFIMSLTYMKVISEAATLHCTD